VSKERRMKASCCLHPKIEETILEWFDNRTKPAIFLIGPPGVGKTTLAYRCMEKKGFRVSEFNASHTRSGTCFKKTILPLLQRGGVIHMVQNGGQQGGLGVILDEIDGLSTGEKGGLSTLLDYLRDWKPSNPGVPVIFISNSLSQRKLLMITRYCITLQVGAPDEAGIRSLIGHDIPMRWKEYGEGDLRPLLRGEYNKQDILKEYFEENMIDIPDGVVPLSHWVLYNEMDPLLTLQLENNDSNLAGLVIAENLTDRLDGALDDKRAAWLFYCKLFECIQESDYADYWAYFYQTWRLLGLSQEVKINTINRILQSKAPWPHEKKRVPPVESTRYTPVLTKQSALFNAWKLLCEIADTQGVPIRMTPHVLLGSDEKKPEKRKKIDAMDFRGIFVNSDGLGQQKAAAPQN
jgi:GTPase SAR1 family protein